MRKYVVPIVALAGIALLSPRADSATAYLAIKSRAGVPGHPVSLPVAVTMDAANSTLQLWGLDFAWNYQVGGVNTGGLLAAGNDTTYNAAFTPKSVTGSTEVPVVVSGQPTVGTGVTNPDYYIGIVRGTSAFSTAGTASANVPVSKMVPTASIGLIRLNVTASLTTDKGKVVDLKIPTTYNVANTGNGSTTNARPGATGATSTQTAGDPVASIDMVVLDTFPGAGGANAIRVPAHKVAIAALPGDIQIGSPDRINSGDLSLIARGIATPSLLNDYMKIAGDVAPAVGYVKTDPTTWYNVTNNGTGLGYGDGVINSADLSAIAQQIASLGAKADFPVAE